MGFVSDGMFVWRDEERVVGFMDWMWRWMGVIGMDGSDGCVGRCVCVLLLMCLVLCMRVCVLCVECLSIQEESTPFDEPHHTPHSPSNSHTYTHPPNHHSPPTPNPPPIPNPPTTLTPPQQHPTTH